MMKNHLFVALAGMALATGLGLSPRLSASGLVFQMGPGAGGGAWSDDEPGWESIAQRFGGTKADTKPCKDVAMAFTIAVEVKDVLVKGGQAVKAGELLIRAKDDEQVAVVAGQKIQAENVYRIRNAELQKELADKNFKRIDEAMQQGSAQPSEHDQRRIEAASAAVALDQEKAQHELEQQRLAQAVGLLSRYRLNAQFDGIVDEVRVEVGQGVRESDPVIRVVDINRLRMDAYAPTQETIRLGIKNGHKAWVLVALPDKPRIVEGEVVEVSPVADSVSQTRRVRVEFENTEGWPAGIPVMVRFTDPGAEWSEYRLETTKRPISAGAGPEKGDGDAGARAASDAR